MKNFGLEIGIRFLILNIEISMVLTVTINPLLETRYEIDSLIQQSTMRAVKEYNYAGGKGINVSRQLNKLKIENLALTFSGG
ncbi:MAG: hypothetical protein KAR20_06990, partial [Candidatus Heimdallarchaeota archaeon]|nr:hypothetical protein [Candidatus Heimdallarchaeota archaeon]